MTTGSKERSHLRLDNLQPNPNTIPVGSMVTSGWLIIIFFNQLIFNNYPPCIQYVFLIPTLLYSIMRHLIQDIISFNVIKNDVLLGAFFSNGIVN